jgi:hypothetical protein
MLGRVVGGIAALGLIGGVGSVAWHEDSATVKVKDRNGVTHSTTLDFDGQQMSCPSDIHDKVDSLVEEIGRIKITLEGVNKYANPGRYNKLADAYNADVNEYNAILGRDCEVAG